MFGDLDEWAAVFAGEICGVNVSDRRAEGDSHANEVTHQTKNQAVDGLIGGVVAEPAAEFVRRDRYSVLLGYPSGFTAAGESDQNDDSLLRQR